MTIPLPQRINVEEVIASSYRNFHAKGMDYVCLHRDQALTLKLYFFDGDVSKLPEVVNPHDHRYSFRTWVVAGAGQNIWYEPGDEHDAHFQQFDWATPLLGGDGFKWHQEVMLRESRRETFAAGESYFMRAPEIHTIRMVKNETVLFLAQFEDTVPPDWPTSTFTMSDVAPPIGDDLYTRFKPDELLALLKRFEERTGYRFQTDART